jgi:hypothetical protein
MNKWFLLTILVSAACICAAADQPDPSAAKAIPVSDDDFWSEDWSPDNFPKISEGRINQILVQIRKENPARADELEKLRKEDINKFRSQIRAEITRLLRQPPPRQGGPGRPPEGPGRQPEEGHGIGTDRTMPPDDRQQQGPRGEPGSPERGGRNRWERMHDEFIAWLEKNYPEEAVTLKQVREKESDKYVERILEKMHLYGPIMQAKPELAKVMKEDLELQKQRDSILRRLRTAAEKDKDKLLVDLKENVSKRFDIIMLRKQLQYDELKKKLEDLQKDVCAQEKQLEKLKNNKDKAVKEQYDKLISEPIKMNWD